MADHVPGNPLTPHGGGGGLAPHGEAQGLVPHDSDSLIVPPGLTLLSTDPPASGIFLATEAGQVFSVLLP